MPRFPKQTQKSELAEAIKEAAWEQISEQGASALSLRAVARKLSITAPAIYNYFPDRDALITALIIDAFTSFGDSQLTANDSISISDLSGRMYAIGSAYRTWAMEHPQRYQLIFGAPLPGYVMPREKVMPSGARSLKALVTVIEELRSKGKLNSGELPGKWPMTQAEFEAWQKFGGKVHIQSFTAAILIWGRVHGLVSLELGGHLPPASPDSNALYDYELKAIHRQFIKE